MQLPEAATRPRVLSVDDDPVMRMLEQETLAQFDFEVSVAADGDEAIELLAGPPPALVLLDVDIPGVDGFAVCRHIRQRWDMSEVPVIMVTGMDDIESVNQAYESGASDFISKPINWPLLGHRARYVLRSAQEARQLRTHDFLGSVATIIAATGSEASQLELELTESILMEPEARRIDGFHRRRKLGVHFSIDQSFVRGLPDNGDDAGITTAIIAMAHSLGLEVIAEGVETRAQLEFLRQANCPKMQGYLFSRPRPPEGSSICYGRAASSRRPKQARQVKNLQRPLADHQDKRERQ
ncbi:MAG: EAL domain-containing response regulator [Candidatus Accumulibacter meliphilus]|jgi:DNA-binding response OmpR family regulator|uniref:response regulator n=1 Tax=Candidatus Accumulibacter meliphilus TaxID=2211374 RepID=UPI002FC2874B